MLSSTTWSDEDLRSLIDVVPALVSFFDATHHCRFANDHHRYWYGRTPSELVGRHMRHFLGDEGYASRQAYLERVARGEVVAFEAKVPHLDGSTHDASIRYVPKMGPEGFIGFYILVFDTAPLQHRFRSVFDGTAVAFWEIDVSEALAVIAADGSARAALIATRSLDLNKTAAALFGVDRSISVGQSIDPFFPDDSEEAFLAILAALSAGEASYEAEVELCREDGTAIRVLCSCAFPAHGRLGERIVLGLMDLSDRIEREAALAKLQNELAHAARVAVLGELTASIAHEVNQPLGAVVNNGNAALRWLNRPEPQLAEVRNSLERVVGEATRAADIIARTRAMAAKGTVERAPVSPELLIRETVALVERQLTAQGVAFHLDIASDLPVVVVDRIQIQQVLVNLLVNAGQAMAGQPDPGIVTLSAELSDQQIAFVVEDTGPGIDPGVASQVFNAFYSTKPTGMGIGLSISKTIVEAHGGTIQVENGPEGGARFTFSLPFQP